MKVICCSLSPVLVRDAGDDGGLDEAARPVVGRQLQLGLAGVQLCPRGGPGQLQVAHHLDTVIYMRAANDPSIFLITEKEGPY